MIVKDEAPVIERCLSSVRPFIDSWLIVDTGSTDKTRKLVRRTLAGVPGKLVRRPWVDFGHNRSESLALARGRADYSWVIDADEVFVPDVGWSFPELTADAYALPCLVTGAVMWRTSLLANRLPFHYVGALHEQPYVDGPLLGRFGLVQLGGAHVQVHLDGARGRGLTREQKSARDVTVLEAALRDDPGNARNQYYLAASLMDAGQPERALVEFEKRARMRGWAEEVYDSLYAVAQLHERLGSPPELVEAAYIAAHVNRPTRAEPLYALACYHQKRGDHESAVRYAQRAVKIPLPTDRLFVEVDVYAWKARAVLEQAQADLLSR